MALTEQHPDTTTQGTHERRTSVPTKASTSRRWSRRLIAGAVALGLAAGVSGGYLAHRLATGPEPVARGRAADSARLEAQAEAYRAAVAQERGRAADSARLEAQAEAYLADQAQGDN